MSSKTWIASALFAVVGLALLSQTGNAADAKPDDEGFVRDWLFLGPFDLGAEDAGADEIAKSQIPDEGAIKPKEGDKQTVGTKEGTWKAVKAKSFGIDLNDLLGKQNEDVLGYLVTYIVAEKDMPGLSMAVASNDQARIYLNGKEVYKFTDTRTLEKDTDKVDNVTLNKGVNVIVFKVINQKNDWGAGLRFKDKDGKPVSALTVKTAP